MIINGSDPIDGESVNKLYQSVDKIKDSLINLMWRQAVGPNDRTVKSLDEKRIQVLAATVPIKEGRFRDNEIAIDVNFFNAFSGKNDPTVVAMPDSPSPYGISVKKVNKAGFTLVIHKFADNEGADKNNITAVHYIAVGLP